MSSIPSSSSAARRGGTQLPVICIGIDGTCSQEAYNINGNTSNTKRFVESIDLHGGKGIFRNGPHNAITGSDLKEIIQDAFNEYKAALADLKKRGAPAARVVLVGHSRGCAGVLTLAQMFSGAAMTEADDPLTSPTGQVAFSMMPPAAQIQMLKELEAKRKRSSGTSTPVGFMGLFDAVDRTSNTGEVKTIPKNVAYAAHALRLPALGSRTSFGNIKCGHSPPTIYVEKEFNGTHGAIGGAPPEACNTVPSWSQVSLPKVTVRGWTLFGGADFALMPKGTWLETCNYPLTKDQQAFAASNAYAWVLQQAMRAGFGFKR